MRDTRSTEGERGSAAAWIAEVAREQAGQKVKRDLDRARRKVRVKAR
jgi:hypothetical protein